MTQEETKAEISKIPINILFDPEGVKKKDIWEIDLMQILKMLISVLENQGADLPNYTEAIYIYVGRDDYNNIVMIEPKSEKILFEKRSPLFQ